MTYQILATFYDELVKDDQATTRWVKFIKEHISGANILELACGSGEITKELAKSYTVKATDISVAMLDKAKCKTNLSIAWEVLDMRKLDDVNEYDGVVCLCDSMNYILHIHELTDVCTRIFNSLKGNGTFIMDMHSMDRLEEFIEPFDEVGTILNHNYEWNIYSDEQMLYQTFLFYDQHAKVEMEQHIQRVYDPLEIKKILQAIGFGVTIFTDFIHQGICEGEKQFFVCRKENV